MNVMKIKNLRGECQHCGKPLEFHAEHTGTVAACPHCGRQTELWLAMPRVDAAPQRRRAMIFFVVAMAILLAGLVALRWVFLRAQSRVKPPNQSTPPDLSQQLHFPLDFQSGPGRERR